MKLKKINHPLYKIIYLLIYMINVHIMVTSCKKHKNIWKNILNNNSNCIIFYGDENQEENYILNIRQRGKIFYQSRKIILSLLRKDLKLA